MLNSPQSSGRKPKKWLKASVWGLVQGVPQSHTFSDGGGWTGCSTLMMKVLLQDLEINTGCW